MVEIVFESHATTTDNEAGIASGWDDVGLSDLGLEQAKNLGERRKKESFNMIFCSDLQRSYKTGEIAFKGIFPIKQDARLRECNYGDLNGKSEKEVKYQKPERIKQPFPGGESYAETNTRMKEFLQELLDRYDGKRVMIIGHRATQYALESLILGKPLEEVVSAPWSWQPGWTYTLKSLH